MKNWIQAARVFVIGASVLPAIFGALLAYNETGRFDIVLFALTLLGVSLLHFAANLFNDYYDFKSGADSGNKEAVFPFSGGSRVIVEGRITPQAVKRAATLCVVGASLIGVYLSAVVGVWVMVLGLFGALTSVLYVHPRASLINLGVGELVVGLDFGLLTVCGAYYVQAGTVSLACAMSSLPIAMIISLILVANEFPDYNGDKEFSKKTIVVRMGRKNASVLVTGLLALTALSIVMNAALGFMSPWSLTALLALPFMLNAAAHALRFHDNVPRMLPANISIINSHLFVNTYLALSCLLIGKLAVVGAVLMSAVFVYQLSVMTKLNLMKQLAVLKSDSGMVTQ